MDPNIDFLGICQLLKALRAIGFSESEVKRRTNRIASKLGTSYVVNALHGTIQYKQMP